jgi:hypothetical protein
VDLARPDKKGTVLYEKGRDPVQFAYLRYIHVCLAFCVFYRYVRSVRTIRTTAPASVIFMYRP